MIVLAFDANERQILSDILRGLPEAYSPDNDYVEAIRRLLNNQVEESKLISEHCRETIFAIKCVKYGLVFGVSTPERGYLPIARNMLAWAKENTPKLKTPLPEHWCPHCGQSTE